MQKTLNDSTVILGKRTPRLTDPSESQEQQQLVSWTDFMQHKYPELNLLYHIPNGGKRSKSEAARFKAEGVKSGVPDLCLPVARGGYHGLYIEMKTESGHTSDEQEWWGERLQAQGYVWRVCHGWQAAVAVLEWYLQL